VFHLANPCPAHWSEIVHWINEFGYSVRQYPFDQWQAEIFKRTRRRADNVLHPLMPLLVDSIPDDGMSSRPLFSLVRMPHFDCRQVLDGLAGTSIACPRVDGQLIGTYLSYFVQCRFLDAPAPN
jgi:hypothetical protein